MTIEHTVTVDWNAAWGDCYAPDESVRCHVEAVFDIEENGGDGYEHFGQCGWTPRECQATLASFTLVAVEGEDREQRSIDDGNAPAGLMLRLEEILENDENLKEMALI